MPAAKGLNKALLLTKELPGAQQAFMNVASAGPLSGGANEVRVARNDFPLLPIIVDADSTGGSVSTSIATK